MGLQRFRHDSVTEQQHVHWVSDAIQPSHPLLLSSPLAHDLICRADIENGHVDTVGVRVVVQSLSLCNSVKCVDRSTPGFPAFTTSWSFLKLMSIESVMPSNQLILCRLLLPSIFPASGSFLISWLFASGIGQSIGASVSASVLPMNIWGWFPLGLTGFRQQ